MMIFIVDVNIVFSGLVKDSLTREILIDSPFTLYAPETMLNSIRKYENLILKKSGLGKDEFEILFNLLIENITIIKKEEYMNYLEEAEKIIGYIDKEDVPFIALAMAIPNNGIWTDDKDFEKQTKIKIWKTEDILKLIKNAEEVK